jgi:Fe-S-cluster containining protein
MGAESLIEEVRKEYSALDAKIADFVATTGLACPSGCGRCCENPNVTATPLEAILLAASMPPNGTVPDSSICMFYESKGNGRGQCLAYEARPLVCRLFGFASHRKRDGSIGFRPCGVHSHEAPDQTAAAVESAVTAPLYSDWSSRLRSIRPGWMNEEMPINHAVKEAFQFRLLRFIGNG